MNQIVECHKGFVSIAQVIWMIWLELLLEAFLDIPEN